MPWICQINDILLKTIVIQYDIYVYNMSWPQSGGSWSKHVTYLPVICHWLFFNFPSKESMELERGSTGRTTTTSTLYDVNYEIAFSHCQGSQDLQIIVINSVNQRTSPRQVFPSSLFLLVSVVRVWSAVTIYIGAGKTRVTKWVHRHPFHQASKWASCHWRTHWWLSHMPVYGISIWNWGYEDSCCRTM